MCPECEGKSAIMSCGHPELVRHQHGPQCYSPVPETEAKGNYLTCKLMAGCQWCESLREAVEGLERQVAILNAICERACQAVGKPYQRATDAHDAILELSQAEAEREQFKRELVIAGREYERVSKAWLDEMDKRNALRVRLQGLVVEMRTYASSCVTAAKEDDKHLYSKEWFAYQEVTATRFADELESILGGKA